MSKKKVILTESKLTEIITSIILENKREGWGHNEIDDLYLGLGDDEDVHLSDTTGDLKGQVVNKKEYLKRMLMSAYEEKNWGKVHHAILYIESKMK